MIGNQQQRRHVASRGEKHIASKLCDEDVVQILDIVAYREKLKKELSTLTNKHIAEKFDVHIRTIDRITVNESWAHIPRQVEAS